jgi:hypothetical protein
MTDKLYTVRFKPPETSVQPVKAARHEVSGDCLVLFDQNGNVAALFDLDVVESWSEEQLPE